MEASAEDHQQLAGSDDGGCTTELPIPTLHAADAAAGGAADWLAESEPQVLAELTRKPRSETWCLNGTSELLPRPEARSGEAMPPAELAPEPGDLVVLSARVPAEHRGCTAVVTSVQQSHCTVKVLDASRQYGVEECWPGFHDIRLISDAWRLGSHVVINGLKKKRLNGTTGVISEHLKEGHPTFICKPAAPDRPQLTLCIRVDDPGSVGAKTLLVEAKFVAREAAAAAGAPPRRRPPEEAAEDEEEDEWDIDSTAEEACLAPIRQSIVVKAAEGEIGWSWQPDNAAEAGWAWEADVATEPDAASEASTSEPGVEVVPTEFHPRRENSFINLVPASPSRRPGHVRHLAGGRVVPTEFHPWRENTFINLVPASPSRCHGHVRHLAGGRVACDGISERTLSKEYLERTAAAIPGARFDKPHCRSWNPRLPRQEPAEIVSSAPPPRPARIPELIGYAPVPELIEERRRGRASSRAPAEEGRCNVLLVSPTCCPTAHDRFHFTDEVIGEIACPEDRGDAEGGGGGGAPRNVFWRADVAAAEEARGVVAEECGGGNSLGGGLVAEEDWVAPCDDEPPEAPHENSDLIFIHASKDDFFHFPASPHRSASEEEGGFWEDTSQNLLG